MNDGFFSTLITKQKQGHAVGIASICSAHPVVLESALERAAQNSWPVLIEATCNQVNQLGGYTGMNPADFRSFVLDLAQKVGCAAENIILGGDHLGPNPWQNLPAEQAMAHAKAMVAAYVEAGFTKIHLDASMSCADDPTPLPVPVVAERAAALAAVAEAHAGGRPLSYVIGTEVPVPGGATEHVEHLEVTTPEDAAETIEAHRRAFAAAGIGAALERVIGLVVQPGVEFGHDNVVIYDPASAKALAAAGRDFPLVFEAHSTDYQSEEALRALVSDGFAILKVGPWLTFALREALYGLDLAAQDLFGSSTLRSGMEEIMQREPKHWQRYYHGDELTQRLQRHYSYSDRIRYYWASPEPQRLVDQMLARFGSDAIPETLISQYLPQLWADVVAGRIEPRAGALLRAAVGRVIDLYNRACGAAANG